MSNEEILRRALSQYEQLRDLSYDTGYYAACMEKAGDKTYAPLHAEAVAKRNKITRKMAAALDATAGDLDQLVKWLQQDEGDYVSSEMQFSVIRVSRLLDHIREMESGSGQLAGGSSEAVLGDHARPREEREDG